MAVFPGCGIMSDFASVMTGLPSPRQKRAKSSKQTTWVWTSVLLPVYVRDGLQSLMPFQGMGLSSFPGRGFSGGIWVHNSPLWFAEGLPGGFDGFVRW
jgi:hypothetical protein